MSGSIATNAFAQSITPVTGFRHASQSDPFATQDVAEVISTATAIAGSSVARATISMYCTNKSTLGFNISLVGTNVDIVTTSSVHTTPNLFGPAMQYSSQDHAVSLQIRFDSNETMSGPVAATDSHHIHFTLENLDDALSSNHLLIGFTANGARVALQLSLREAAVAGIIRSCKAGLDSKEKAGAEYSQQQDVDWLAKSILLPSGFPCKATAIRDMALTRVDYVDTRNHSGGFTLDYQYKVKAGSTFYLQKRPDTSSAVALTFIDPSKGVKDAVVGYADTNYVKIQCNGNDVAGVETTSQSQETPHPFHGVRVSSMDGQITRKVVPQYPADAKAAHVSGVVTLQVIISTTGMVDNAEALGGPAPLRAAALDAVKQWRYKPYTENGVPVAVETLVTVPFRP